MIEKIKEGIVFPLDDKRFPIRRSISYGKTGSDRAEQCALSRAIVLSFGIGNRYFGEEDIRLPRDLMRSNNEYDMSPEEGPCVVVAGIDFVVSAAVAIRVVVPVTIRANIVIVVVVV